MRDDQDWIGRALRDAGGADASDPPVDVADRVLRTLADRAPPGVLAPTRSLVWTAAVCCAVAGSAAAAAAQAWSAASDPLAGVVAPVRLALNDG